MISCFSWICLLFYLPETKPTNSKINFLENLENYKLILADKTFLSAAIIPSLLYACYLTFVAIAPFIYINFFNLNILSYTYHQASIILISAITSAISGKVNQYFGVKSTILISLLFCLLGSCALFTANHAVILTMAMSLFCIGFALLYPIIFAYSMEIFPALKGPASSMIMSLRYLLCSIISGVGSYFYHLSPQPISIAITIFVVFVMIAILSNNLKSIKTDQKNCLT